MLARIVHMVAEAQRSRAPIQRLADATFDAFIADALSTPVSAAAIPARKEISTQADAFLAARRTGIARRRAPPGGRNRDVCRC
jgi:cation transport ATPase